MFDNDYVLLEKIFDSSNMEIRDSGFDSIFSRLYSELLKKFMEGIPSHFAASDKLRDNALNGIYDILDSGKERVKDCKSNDLLGKGYSSDTVLDSHGRNIDCHAVFVS